MHVQSQYRDSPYTFSLEYYDSELWHVSQFDPALRANIN